MKLDIDRRIKTAIKIIGSLVLISYVLYTVGPYKIIGELKSADLLLFSIVILLGVIRVAISAKKWQLLLKAKDIFHGFKEVWRIYYIGNFFNMFLPTNVGGDVVKAHKMSKRSESPVDTYSSVFMERFTGVVVIISLAVVSSLIYFKNLPTDILLLIFGIILPSLIVLILLIFHSEISRGFESIYKRLFRSFNPFSIRRRLKKLHRSITSYRENGKVILYALLISLIFHVLLILSNFILSLSIGMDISLQYFFIFVPLTAILLFLPISIRGFGVREALYLYFFTSVGASGAKAVSLSFLVQIINIIGSSIGGGVYLFSASKED